MSVRSRAGSYPGQRGSGRGFSALLLGICLVFYLFFAFLDGAVIAVDSPSYISMEITREPLYPMLLSAFRLLCRAALPFAGEDFYLTAVAFFQSILMAAAVWCLVRYLWRELRLPRRIALLMLLVPFSVSLLCRFAAARGSMYSNSILTEGIAIPLYLIFFRFLLQLCLYGRRRSLVMCLALSFLLYATRKQMAVALAMLMVCLFVSHLRGGYPMESGRAPGRLRARLAGGLLSALMSAVFVLGAGTLLDMGYNYVLRGEAVRHSSDGRFVTTMVFYTAEREDAEYIEDPALRSLFLEIYDACDEAGYLGHSAQGGWLSRVTHFGDHYDNIQIDIMWPAVNAYVTETFGGDEISLNGAADEVMRIFNVSVGPHNAEKIFSAFCDNLLSGLVTTVAQRRPVLIVYSVLVYLLFLLLLLFSLAGRKREYHPLLAQMTDKVNVVAGLTLLGIACNVGLVSLVIFCQTRYTIYNMPLFYISLILLLYLGKRARCRGARVIQSPN